MYNPEFQTGVIRPVECFKEGWELIKSDYWILFAISLVGAMIGGFSLYILLGAMICGIYYCFLQKIDTGNVSFDDLVERFFGFSAQFSRNVADCRADDFHLRSYLYSDSFGGDDGFKTQFRRIDDDFHRRGGG